MVCIHDCAIQIILKDTFTLTIKIRDQGIWLSRPMMGRCTRHLTVGSKAPKPFSQQLLEGQKSQHAPMRTYTDDRVDDERRC